MIVPGFSCVTIIILWPALLKDVKIDFNENKAIIGTFERVPAIEKAEFIVKEIKKADDFHLLINDTYARAGIEYEYC